MRTKWPLLSSPLPSATEFFVIEMSGDYMHAQALPNNHLRRTPLGATGLSVTPICIGTSPLASMPGLYGYEVGHERAVATVLSVFTSPINFMDTSNGYGQGASERRIGEAIRRHGGLPSGFVLATKADPDPITGDFSGARIRASVEESLERLGLSRLQLLYLHDPERLSFEEGMAVGGPVEAMVALRNEGIVENVGVAGGPIGLLERYIHTDIFDVVLTHNRYSLLDRSADRLLDLAAHRRMGVVNAAPYGGGMLARGPEVQPKYAYGQGATATRGRALAMQHACLEYAVPLPAAALQFSIRDRRISSTVVGVSSPDRIGQTLDLLHHPIPEALWDKLQILTPPSREWLG